MFTHAVSLSIRLELKIFPTDVSYQPQQRCVPAREGRKEERGREEKEKNRIIRLTHLLLQKLMIRAPSRDFLHTIPDSFPPLPLSKTTSLGCDVK